MSHEGETFTDSGHTWMVEAELPCGCFVIRETEVGEVHGISYCALHESASSLLEALQGCVDSGIGRALPEDVAEKARIAIAGAKQPAPAFIPFLDQG